MPRSRNTTGWPVMPAQCQTCPFRDQKDRSLAVEVLNRTGLHASQICHHPKLSGKKETHLCRGVRDHQLTLLFRLGYIEDATDTAFTKASEAALRSKN